jgi:hypothetical protein
MTFTAIVAFIKSLADLGASPAVQTAASKFFAEQMGVDQKLIDEAVRNQKDAPPVNVTVKP